MMYTEARGCEIHNDNDKRLDKQSNIEEDKKGGGAVGNNTQQGNILQIAKWKKIDYGSVSESLLYVASRC